MKKTAGLILIIAAAILFRAVDTLPTIGDPQSPSATHVSPRYIENGPKETGAANMVTGVLADYRGFDTLGETTVIFTAGLACLLLLGATWPNRQAQPDSMEWPFGSAVLEAAIRFATPFMLLFATYVVIHGHDTPGGGFQGGELYATTLILIKLTRGTSIKWAPSPQRALLIASSGVALFAGIGFLSLVFGGSYLDYGVLPLPFPSSTIRTIGTLGIEIGVALTVTGVLLLVFEMLTAWHEKEDSQ